MAEQNKSALDIRVGDQIPTVRTVTKIEQTAQTVTVTFDDGGIQSFDVAAGNRPAVPVVVADVDVQEQRGSAQVVTGNG